MKYFFPNLREIQVLIYELTLREEEMNRIIIACLNLIILCSVYVPALADTTDSTNIGINVVVKEIIPCQFQFSARSGNGSRDYSRTDSFDCATNSNKLYEKATNVSRQAIKESDKFTNQVRVVMTVE